MSYLLWTGILAMHVGAPTLASVAALREAAKQKDRMAKLYFYYAAMNAGKSTTLLQADFNYRERGMETMLWTAAHDERSGSGTIGSRIALSAPAHSYDQSVDLFGAVSDELKKRRLDCVLIDEAQ